MEAGGLRVGSGGVTVDAGGITVDGGLRLRSGTLVVDGDASAPGDGVRSGGFEVQ